MLAVCVRGVRVRDVCVCVCDVCVRGYLSPHGSPLSKVPACYRLNCQTRLTRLTPSQVSLHNKPDTGSVGFGFGRSRELGGHRAPGRGASPGAIAGSWLLRGVVARTCARHGT